MDLKRGMERIGVLPNDYIYNHLIKGAPDKAKKQALVTEALSRGHKLAPWVWNHLTRFDIFAEDFE